MPILQPPPTWALPILVNPETKDVQFHPVWLKWFVDLSAILTGIGGSVPSHNLLSGLQGGATNPNEFFHLTQTDFTTATGIDARVTEQETDITDLETSVAALQISASGSMYNDNTPTTVTIPDSTGFHDVAGGMSAGPVNGMVFQNSKELKASTAGVFLAMWSASVQCATANHYIEGTLGIGGTANLTMVSGVDQTAVKDFVIGGAGILTLAVNDLVRLMLKNSATADLTISHATVALRRISA